MSLFETFVLFANAWYCSRVALNDASAALTNETLFSAAESVFMQTTRMGVNPYRPHRLSPWPFAHKRYLLTKSFLPPALITRGSRFSLIRPKTIFPSLRLPAVSIVASLLSRNGCKPILKDSRFCRALYLSLTTDRRVPLSLLRKA